MVTYNPGYKSVGFRDCQVFEIDENGFPKAPDKNPYVGYLISGPKAFTLNIPIPPVIPHIGRDRVEETDQLPSKEAASGEISVSGVDLDTDAFLSGVLKDTVGLYSEFIPRQSDKQGFEPQVGIVAWQQSMLRGARRWHYVAVPSSRAVAIGAGMGDAPIDHRYQININPVAKLPWGTALTIEDNGALSNGYVDIYSTIVPVKQFPLVAFKADGIEDEYVFPDYANGKDDYPVFVNGVLVTGDITKADGEFTFTDYIPEEDDIITIWLA